MSFRENTLTSFGGRTRQDTADSHLKGARIMVEFQWERKKNRPDNWTDVTLSAGMRKSGNKPKKHYTICIWPHSNVIRDPWTQFHVPLQQAMVAGLCSNCLHWH